MEYTPELAQPFIGKRVVVSIRNIEADGEETFSGFYGVIDSAHEGGLVLRVEGQGDDKYWVMPPDLGALEPAEAEAYQLTGSILWLQTSTMLPASHQLSAPKTYQHDYAKA